MGLLAPFLAEKRHHHQGQHLVFELGVVKGLNWPCLASVSIAEGSVGRLPISVVELIL